jgi:hypothetical protein
MPYCRSDHQKQTNAQELSIKNREALTASGEADRGRCAWPEDRAGACGLEQQCDQGRGGGGNLSSEHGDEGRWGMAGAI